MIDNSAGLIPVPMTEIEINRTIFRSGESEYRIGGQVVRLLDVQELLSETGIGRALHTVVGQGQLEDVLTARPEDRRTYIEEAAGVAKHRKRKERAERKLAGLDQDVLRLQDVLAELKRQLKPLRQQAEMAKRHETLTAEADTVAIRLAAARLRDLWDERERRKEGMGRGASRAGPPRANGSTRSTGASRPQPTRRARSVWALQEAEAAFVEAQSAKSAAELELRRAVELESEARQAVAAADQPRRAAARRSRRTCDGSRRGSPRRRTSSRARARELEAAEAAFASAADARRDAEDERRRLRRGGGAPRRDGDVPPFARVARSRAFAAGGVARAGPGAPDDRRGGARGARGRRRTTRRVHGAARRSPVRAGARAARAGRHGRGARGGQRRLELRRDVLRARLDDLERTPAPASSRSTRAVGVGLLGQLIRAVDGWDRALRAGLGALADAVVYEDADRALRRRPRRARARRWRWRAAGPPRFELSGERTLLSIVDADPTVRGLASTLLKDIYLAETLEEAAAKHAEHPGASFVTPDGVLVGPALIRTTLTADSRAEEVRRELAVVERDLSRSVSALKPRRARLDEISGELAELRGGDRGERTRGSPTPPNASRASTGSCRRWPRRTRSSRNGLRGWTTRPRSGARTSRPPGP